MRLRNKCCTSTNGSPDTYKYIRIRKNPKDDYGYWIPLSNNLYPVDYYPQFSSFELPTIGDDKLPTEKDIKSNAIVRERMFDWKMRRILAINWWEDRVFRRRYDHNICDPTYPMVTNRRVWIIGSWRPR